MDDCRHGHRGSAGSLKGPALGAEAWVYSSRTVWPGPVAGPPRSSVLHCVRASTIPRKSDSRCVVFPFLPLRHCPYFCIFSCPHTHETYGYLAGGGGLSPPPPHPPMRTEHQQGLAPELIEPAETARHGGGGIRTYLPSSCPSCHVPGTCFSLTTAL